MKYFELAATSITFVTAAFKRITEELLQVAWYVAGFVSE
jgi:hypothetical protein